MQEYISEAVLKISMRMILLLFGVMVHPREDHGISNVKRMTSNTLLTAEIGAGIESNSLMSIVELSDSGDDITKVQ